jgi:hypothetical protein
MEVSDVRRRLRHAIDEAKRHAADRRARVDQAARTWSERLPDAVVPAVHAVHSALAGEGYRFTVSTPGDTAHLALERSAAEFVEVALDTDRESPAVVLRSTRGRGRRTVTSERVIAEGAAIAELSQDAIVDAVIQELVPFIER